MVLLCRLWHDQQIFRKPELENVVEYNYRKESRVVN
jgi:hypothetical protein